MSSPESDTSKASEYGSDDNFDIVENDVERDDPGAHSHAAATVAEEDTEFDSDEGPHQFDLVGDEEFLAEYEREAGRRGDETKVGKWCVVLKAWSRCRHGE